MEIFFGAFTADWERKRATMLRDRLVERVKRPGDDELRRRSAGFVPTAPAGSFRSGRSLSGPGSGQSSSSSPNVRFASSGLARSERSMASRFAGLAFGAQPSVVKAASFGGGSRVKAMVSYVSRGGELALENQRGEQRLGQDGAIAVAAEWKPVLAERSQSRDLATFTIEVTAAGSGQGLTVRQAQAVVEQALGERAFAFAVETVADGLRINGLTVLRDRSGERLSGDAKAAKQVQARLEDWQGQAHNFEPIRFRFTGHGNGTEYGSNRLRQLVSDHPGQVYDEQGGKIDNVGQAGELVQQHWRGLLHSRKPRDVVHLVLSARAGTPVEAFRAAARDFLSSEFAGHHYVFSVHDPASDPKAAADGGKRPHIHVHAVVALQSDYGDRRDLTIADFRRFRVTMAEKARAHGIMMEMTDRRESAAAPAYLRQHIRPGKSFDRSRYEGTSEAGQRRYDAKRQEQVSVGYSDKSRFYADMADAQWRILASSVTRTSVREFAQRQMRRLSGEERVLPEAGSSRPGAGIGPRLAQAGNDQATGVDLGRQAMRQMNRREFEVYETRVEAAISRAERGLPEGERKAFEEVAHAARDHVDVRREMVELEEGRRREVAEAKTSIEQSDAGHRSPARPSRIEQPKQDKPETAADRLLFEIEQARQAIDRTEAGIRNADDVRQLLRQSLDRDLAQAGRLALAGNRVIREAASRDKELGSVVEAMSRDRNRNSEPVRRTMRDVESIFSADKNDRGKAGEHRQTEATSDAERGDRNTEQTAQAEQAERSRRPLFQRSRDAARSVRREDDERER